MQAGRGHGGLERAEPPQVEPRAISARSALWPSTATGITWTSSPTAPSPRRRAPARSALGEARRNRWSTPRPVLGTSGSGTGRPYRWPAPVRKRPAAAHIVRCRDWSVGTRVPGGAPPGGAGEPDPARPQAPSTSRSSERAVHVQLDLDGSRRDLEIVVHHPDATVADLLDALDPGRRARAALAVDGRSCPARQRLDRAGIVSGATLQPTRGDHHAPGPRPPPRPGARRGRPLGRRARRRAAVAARPGGTASAGLARRR